MKATEPPKPKQQPKPREGRRSLRCNASVNGKLPYQHLQAVALLYANFYDTMLDQRLSALQNNLPIPTSNQQQREIARINAQFPEFNAIDNRILQSAILELEGNWKRYENHKDDQHHPAGVPRHKRQSAKSLACCKLGPANIRFTENTGRPVITIKGLPTLRPKDQRIQPGLAISAITIRLKRGKIQIGLVYKIQLPPKPGFNLHKTATGVDRNIAASLATSNDVIYRSPNLKDIETEIRELQQRRHRITAAAIKRGDAGFRAVPDDHNRQVLTAKGHPRRELYWTKGQPTRGYTRNREQVAKARARKAECQHQFLHRATTAIVRNAVDQGANIIGFEHLQIRNMTKSPKGTVDKPGQNVRAKSTLTFRILEQCWGKAWIMTSYKAERASIETVRVHPAYTSITCSSCGHRDKNSRHREAFLCTRCKDPLNRNSQTNAGRNIADKALLGYYAGWDIDKNSIRMARRFREGIPWNGTTVGGKGSQSPTGAGRTTLIETKSRPKMRTRRRQ